jgi:hypothetical protein
MTGEKGILYSQGVTNVPAQPPERVREFQCEICQQTSRTISVNGKICQQKNCHRLSRIIRDLRFDRDKATADRDKHKAQLEDAKIEIARLKFRTKKAKRNW